MKQHYFDVPFAFSGDVTAIPDPTQVSGSISMTEGWNYNYQRDLTTDPLALPIDRSTMNWLFLQITTALQALQGETVPEFILASQNGGTAFSYGPQAVVLYSASGNAPFAKYVNISGANNTNTPSAADPIGATTGWQVACDPLATSAQAATGTNNASIMTPLLVAQQTALRALLAGNSNQVFNVGTPTVGSHAMPMNANVAPVVSSLLYQTLAPNTTYQTPTISFVAPVSGTVLATAGFNMTSQGALGSVLTGTLSINGNDLSTDQTADAQQHIGNLVVVAGATVNINFSVSVGSTNPNASASLRTSFLFVPHA